MIIQLASFVDDFRDLKLTDDDLRALERLIGEKPETGRSIVGTGGLRKVRFAPPSWNTGKRGATRVCYAWFMAARHVYLFTIYSKNEQGNLSPSDKAYYRSVLQALDRSLKARFR